MCDHGIAVATVLMVMFLNLILKFTMKVCVLMLVCLCGIMYGQTIERSILSNGAVRARGERVGIEGTIGQPMIGVSASVFHRAFHGFWYQAAPGVLTVERTHPIAVRITPQPAVTSATVEVGCSGPVEAALVTLQGQRIAELSFVPVSGGAVATVECTERASGLYLVELRCSGQTMFLPLMIAK